MSKRPVLLGAFSALLLGACATLPSGPSVMVLPGSQKTFEQFREDDALCQFYARQAVGGQTPTQTGVDRGTSSAVAGTAIGAAAGALIGAAAGEPAGGRRHRRGQRALLGSAAGPGAYERSAYALQNRYDITYVQCMYTKGNQVPVSAAYRGAFSRYQPTPPPAPPGAKPPLPPPGVQPPFPHQVHSRRPTIGDTDFDAVGYQALHRPAPLSPAGAGRRSETGLRLRAGIPGGDWVLGCAEKLLYT